MAIDYPSKPDQPFLTTDVLAESALCAFGLGEGTGAPYEHVAQVASAFTSGTGNYLGSGLGSLNPSWTSGLPWGYGLSFPETVSNHYNEVRATGAGLAAGAVYANLTLAAVLRLTGAISAGLTALPFGLGTSQSNPFLGIDENNRIRFVYAGNQYAPTSPITLTAGRWYAIAVAINGTTPYFHVFDYTSGTETSGAGASFSAAGSVTSATATPATMNCRSLGFFPGDISAATSASRTWSASDFRLFVADPARSIRPGRDNDALAHAATLINASGAFGDVRVGQKLEDLIRSGEETRVAVLNAGAAEETPFAATEDGGESYMRKVMFKVEIAVRDPNPEARDAEIDRLEQIVVNRVSGRSLARLTFPGKTMIRRSRYADAKQHPEQRAVLDGEFTYLVSGRSARNEN